MKGVVFKETVVLRRWGSSIQNFGFIRSDEGLTLETSAFRISLRWSIYIINSVDNITLSLVSFQLYFLSQQIMFESDIFFIGACFFFTLLYRPRVCGGKKISLCVSPAWNLVAKDPQETSYSRQ